MRRFISILVAVLMVLTLLPLDRAVLAADEGNGTTVEGDNNLGENEGQSNPTVDQDLENAKSALKDKIDEAKGLADVDKLTAEQKTDFDNAISKAEVVFNNSSSTKEALENATKELASAIETAKTAIEEAKKAEAEKKAKEEEEKKKAEAEKLEKAKEDLQAKIAEAKKVKDDPGYAEIDQATKDYLDNMIASGEKFSQRDTWTSADYESVISAINSAINSVKKAIERVVAKKALDEEIAKAEEIVNSEGFKKLSEEDQKTLKAAIESAKNPDTQDPGPKKYGELKDALTKAIDEVKAKLDKKPEEPKETEEEKKARELKEAKEALAKSVKEAEELQKKEEYKKLSDADKKSLEDALTAAKEVEKNDKAETKDIKAATEKLDSAVKSVESKLAPKDDKKEAREALKKSIDAAKLAKETDKYKNAADSKKLALDNALTLAESTYKDEKLSVETVKEVKKSLDAAFAALDGKVTPKEDYSSRVPLAVRKTIANAKAVKAAFGYSRASYSSRYSFETALSNLETIANRFENGYYGRYYNGYYDRYYNGYYDRYYNGYYYVNGVPYSYYEFYNKFGYYPDKYRYGYDNGYYDRYYNGYYYKNGRAYTYYEFYDKFGYYPDRYYDGYYDGYYGDWDPYYGYNYNRYGYYGYDIRDAVEKVVDNIRAIAVEVGPYYPSVYAYRNLEYPTYSEYEGYYDYGYDYPWYDGYYYDRGSVSELKKLIGEAEELAYSRKDESWNSYKSDLVDAAAYGRKAVQGRASVRDAINELEEAIKKAKTEGMKTYIRRAYMKGVDANHFAPNAGLTRAEMAQILANVLEQSGNKVAYNPKNFKDVPAGVWYKRAVDLVSTYNIMIGNPDGTFKPQEKVSIEELIVMAARIGGHTPRKGNVFGIVNHKWSVPYIQTAYANKWIGIDRFNPSDAISRGKATQILNRAMNYGVDKDFINKYAARMNRFADVNSSSPYFYDILAATNTISYQQAPKSNLRYWRAFQDNGKWTDSKFGKGTLVEPYTGW